MITKQGSLSIIKTISKTKAATLQTGPYARHPALSGRGINSARGILDDPDYRIDEKTIIEQYRSSHVEKLKIPRLRVRVRTRVVGRYLYIVTSVT